MLVIVLMALAAHLVEIGLYPVAYALGDVFPAAHLRFITGVEALNGLPLIAWSGSFIYVAMGRLWPWQTCAEPTCVVLEKTSTDTTP